MSNIDLILNDLDELLESSWNLPLSGGRCVVDAERVRDLIDGIRVNLPTEMKQARAIAADRNKIISDAKMEAEALIHKAEERARVLVDSETIVRSANAKAASIMSDANARASELVQDATSRASATVTQASQRSREMKQAALDFSESMLRSTEETLNRTLAEVKSTRQALSESLAEPGGSRQPVKRKQQ